MPDESRPPVRESARAAVPPMAIPGAASVTSTPVAPSRDPRRWFSDAYVPDPALVARGAMHVRVGIVVMVLALVGTGIAMASVDGAVHTGSPLAKWVSGVLWQSVVAAGILASSRVARVIGIAQAGILLLASVTLTGVALGGGGFGTSVGRQLLALAACMVLMVAGTTLATISPAARAWHAAQQAARAVRRKAKSLADWRKA